MRKGPPLLRKGCDMEAGDRYNTPPLPSPIQWNNKVRESPNEKERCNGDMDVPRPGGIPAASAGDGATGPQPVGSGSKASDVREPPPYNASGTPVERNRLWVKEKARAKARARVPRGLPIGGVIRARTTGRARAAMALSIYTTTTECGPT